jgi:hypothetical protein
MKVLRKIVTHHDYPPIPTRELDWSAHYEGEEEAGMYGHGATEQAAIADFIENYAEIHDERLSEWNRQNNLGRVASTCLETAYGSTVRLSYQIKVF